MTVPEMAAVLADHHRLAQQVTLLQQQLDWLKRQLFGEKSERRLMVDSARQMSLGEGFTTELAANVPVVKTIAAHTRRETRKKPEEGDEAPELFFNDQVPVEVIEIPNPELAELAEDDYEVIGEKITHRLAQRPGSYVILKYVRQVIKRRCDQTLHCPPAPAGVFEGARADVSFVAGMVVDKLAYHLPLYRQHQRLRDAGIEVSRAWLTQIVHKTGALLAPIAESQLESIRQSRVKAMDETPIRAGRNAKGKMNTGYFWPVYGERHEIAFLFYPSRGSQHVREALGHSAPDGAVLISDGYSAYARYAEQTGLTHAQCWSHTRRKFIQAQNAEPEAVEYALEAIGGLYTVERQIGEQQLGCEKKRRYRIEHAKPVLEGFFAWAEQQLADQALLPTNPLTTALNYALERRTGLEVYLTDPEVPIDTNHLERALRPIPMGKKNWLFCWTEVGAKHLGTLQSLIATCRLQDINPYDYLVDVLQRIDRHPASQVHLLTPRLWKQHFADHRLRSDLHAQSP